MKRIFVVVVALTFSMAAMQTPEAYADQATDKARGHYETGLELFYAREHAQALVEFQRAHEIKPRPATLFMMGQCEYLLGELRGARDHYEAYLRESPSGEFVEVAKDRIESINRRPATLVINTVPDQVDVQIVRAKVASPGPSATSPRASGGVPEADVAVKDGLAAPSGIIAGQAPNNFHVPRGRWTISVSKPNYQSEQITVDVEVAETKPLFFKLDPIPARLEVETLPRGATLYVNGNRARNPYRQNIPPGHVELFAQASEYADRAESFVLGPGDRRQLIGPNAFRLRYVQRSGRPELLVASTAMGALFGAGALAGTVAAAANESLENSGNVAAMSLTLGGALAGAIGGALVGNRVIPRYIPDNRALFIIGGMWIGVAEGALAGMVINEQLTTAVSVSASDPSSGSYLRRPTLSLRLKSAFLGSVPGLVVGTTTAALLANRAPTYGRVALIQSAAVGGAVVGGLTSVMLRWRASRWQNLVVDGQVDGSCGSSGDTESAVVSQVGGIRVCPAGDAVLDLSLPALVGLNVGLAAGLMGAYLPDQTRYGPSWTRIALIDLAAGAGALGAGIFACVADDERCLKSNPNSMVRARMAAASLLGGAAGLVAGILLTGDLDSQNDSTDGSPSTFSILPMPAITSAGPMFGAVGSF